VISGNYSFPAHEVFCLPERPNACRRNLPNFESVDSLNFELRRSIDPNFRLALVDLDSASDFHVFPLDVGKYSRLETGDAGKSIAE
jgi:hypothetical protein